jgi:hypothetical protein
MNRLCSTIPSVADPDLGSSAFLPQGSRIRDLEWIFSGSQIPNMTKIKFMNYIVYSLEKYGYRKRRKIILCMNVYYSNHLIRQEKVRFILHLSHLCRIRDPRSRSGINIPDPQHWRFEYQYQVPESLDQNYDFEPANGYQFICLKLGFSKPVWRLWTHLLLCTYTGLWRD